MISVCHNPNCNNMATMRCSGCRSIYYCGRECAKQFWKFHSRECKLSLADVPLPKKFDTPLIANFTLQVYHIVDALDRVVRIIPPNRDFVDVESPNSTKKVAKVEKSSYRKLDMFIEKTDTHCQAERAYEFFIKDSGVDAVPGADLYEEHVKKAEFPLLFSIRLSMMGNSLKFCVSLMSVLETLAAFGGYVPVHGCERLETFFIAKGHIMNNQPRLFTSVEQDRGSIHNKAQAAEKANDHYVILAMPNGIFDRNTVADLAHAESLDKRAFAFDELLTKERVDWSKDVCKTTDQKRRYIQRKLEGMVSSEKCSELMKKIKDRVVFIAPAAGEHDASLHKHRLCKSIPDWFHVSEIYREEQIASMTFSDEFSYDSNMMMHRIMSDLLTPKRAGDIIEVVSKVAENHAKLQRAAMEEKSRKEAEAKATTAAEQAKQ